MAPRVRIFISSSSDLLREREIVERSVARLDGIWQKYVRVEAFRWERRHYEAIRSFQETIGEMAEFDVVLGMVWKRIGTPLPPDKFHRPDGSPYEGGTVFEIESAISCSSANGKPAVYLVRKEAPVQFSAENVEEEQRQYQLLGNWWNRTIRDAEGHFTRGFQSFLTLDDLEQLVEGLIENYLREKNLIPTGYAWDIEAKGSPYPGLIPYDSNFSTVFFGRGLAIASAIEELTAAAARDSPVLIVVGPSGSGKSSLIRAGVLPHFTSNRIAGIDFWCRVLVEPANDPILALAQRLYLADALPNLAESPQAMPEQFAALAHRSPEAAADAIKWALNRKATAEQASIGGGRLPVGRLLLTLDQLETILDNEHQKPFARFVKILVENETTWVVATLRSDRYAALQLNPDFLELRRRSALFDLPPPGSSEIADIIKGPAKSAGLVFEEREQSSLAKEIAAAMSDADALPLLQMTLKRLFDNRNANTLTFAAYEAMGGLDGAIADYADKVFSTVSPEGQSMLDGLLRALVADIDDSLRLTIRTPDRSSVETDSASGELIRKLTEGRLLVSVDGEIRIAHEALLRRWKRAAASPALKPEVIRLRRQIEPNFEVWHRTGLANDLLHPGTTALAAAEAIQRDHPGCFPVELEAYIQRSLENAAALANEERNRAETEARRARRRTYMSAAAAVTFAGLAILAFYLYDRSGRSFTLALLTKAQQLLLAERPAQALVLAEAAAQTNALTSSLQSIGLMTSKSDENIRAKTIAQIARGATQEPIVTWKFPEGVRTVALSTDASTIVVGDQRGRIFVANKNNPSQATIATSLRGMINSVRFSPNGEWIAAASFDRTITLINLKTGETKILCGHESSVTNIAFDPSGRFIASSSNDGSVLIWDAKTFVNIKKIGGHSGWVLAVAFSPDGRTLASSDQKGNVLLHRVSDWSTIKTMATDRIDLVSLAFSADSERLASASAFGQLDIWDANGQRITSIDEQRDRIWQVQFSPDGRYLAVAHWSGTIRFWTSKGQDYRLAGTLDGNDHWIKDIAFSKDSSVILTGGATGAVRLWSTNDLEPMFYTVRDNTRETLSAQYSRDGLKFVTAGTDHFARLYTVDNRGRFNLVCSVEHRDWVRSVSFAPDGRTVVSAGTADGKSDNSIVVWSTEQADAGRCQLQESIAVGNAYVQTVVFSKDGNFISWGTRTGQVWLAARQKDAEPLQLSASDITKLNALDFSRDHKFLVGSGRTQNQRGKVILWNIETKAIVQEFAFDDEEIYSVKFSADGRLIAAGGFGSDILVLQRGNAAPLKRLEMRDGTSELLFSPDGKLLVASSNKGYIAMWSVENWEKIFHLQGLIGIRGVFDFHPKRGDLAFDGENGLVRVLPKITQQRNAGVAVEAELRGTDVFFDQSTRSMTKITGPAVGNSVGASAPNAGAPPANAATNSCMK